MISYPNQIWRKLRLKRKRWVKMNHSLTLSMKSWWSTNISKNQNLSDKPMNLTIPTSKNTNLSWTSTTIKSNSSLKKLMTITMVSLTLKNSKFSWRNGQTGKTSNTVEPTTLPNKTWSWSLRQLSMSSKVVLHLMI